MDVIKLFDMEKEVYTWFKDSPFAIGGSPNWWAGKTTIEVEEIPAVRGVQLYQGTVGDATVIIEPQGGIVGNDYELVKRDLLQADMAIVADQLNQSARDFASARRLTLEKFTEKYSRAKERK